MTPPSKATTNTASRPIGSLKVLVVDDDPFQLELISDTLRGLGVQDITQAATSDQALAAQNRFRTGASFDLLLCDLQMPGKDGFKLMEALAAAGYAGAIIIISGQDSKVLHSASLVAQLRRFKLLGTIQKPVTKPGLGALVNKIAY